MDLSKSYEYFKPEKISGAVHIIGCGSVGSTVAENLARCGVKKMVLWDFDRVESKNIVNQMFREKDIGRPKTEALREILSEINPEILQSLEIRPDGWNGQTLSGYVFLCVDNIEIRREIVEKFYDSPFIKAMFDFRTALESAQHFAADWSNQTMRRDFLNTMQFSHEEAKAEAPTTACGTTLGVAPTVRLIAGFGVCNFINFVRGLPMKKSVLLNAFGFSLDAF